jgi:hypothetical protein
LAREETTFEAVTRPHQEGTRANCQIPGDYLLIEDTTSLNYASRPATAGLGRIGDDRAHGLYLHSNLALKIEGWSEQTPLCSVMGLFHQKCWARTMPPVGVKEKKSQRMSRARESERWAEAYELADAPLPGIRWTHLGDRETDIAEVFARCAAKGLDWIIRTCQARALIDDAGSIFQRRQAGARAGDFRVDPARAPRTTGPRSAIGRPRDSCAHPCSGAARPAQI